MARRKKNFPPALRSFLLIWILLSGSFPVFADEENLEKAIRLIDKKHYEEALPILKDLARDSPNDERVLHALGHVYQSKKQYKEAIELFEKAVQIKPTGRGYYTLGMLYEAMSVDPSGKSGESEWLKKAQDAWNNFLRIKPEDSRRVEVAKRHLAHLKEQLKDHPSK